MLEEQFFDPARHDRAGFSSGEVVLDDFLHKYAAQQNAKGMAAVFVLVDTENPEQILGYYTLSAAQLATGELTELERKKLPRYPVPCFRVGRLARSSQHIGAGLGTKLLGLAVDRCLKVKTQVGAYALLVDAKNVKAKSFYLRYGFTAYADSPNTLYLPLGSCR